MSEISPEYKVSAIAENATKLKPCPFCGKKSMTMETNRQWMGLVCDECGGSAKWDLGVSGAEENWNTRPIEDALQAKLDIAVEALENIVQFHDGYCEHHINVSQHSYDLSNIAHEALKKIKEK